MIFPGILLKSRHECMYANGTIHFPRRQRFFNARNCITNFAIWETCKQFILTGVFDIILYNFFLKKVKSFFHRY